MLPFSVFQNCKESVVAACTVLVDPRTRGILTRGAVAVQLGQGLSSEYTRSERTETAENVDADRDVTARYYLNSVLQMGEEGIRDAWSKVRLRFVVAWSIFDHCPITFSAAHALECFE